MPGSTRPTQPSGRSAFRTRERQRASYTYLVLRALGYKNVAIYDDGWRVYGSNLPLAAEDETWFDFTKVNNVLQAVKDLGKNAHK